MVLELIHTSETKVITTFDELRRTLEIALKTVRTVKMDGIQSTAQAVVQEEIVRRTVSGAIRTGTTQGKNDELHGLPTGFLQSMFEEACYNRFELCAKISNEY